MSEEVVVTDDNFEEYFFDVRRHDPQRGQIMACYTACADFVDTNYKRDVIKLLKLDKAIPATKLMKRFHGATELDSIRIPLQMAEDLHSGMSEDEVAAKAYPLIVEYFFYTMKEYVPTDDPHWTLISLRNLDEFIDEEGGLAIRTKITEGNDVSTKEQLPSEEGGAD